MRFLVFTDEHDVKLPEVFWRVRSSKLPPRDAMTTETLDTPDDTAPYDAIPISPYPFIQAAHFTTASRTKIDLVVIHTMEAPEKPKTAENVARWFAGKDAPQASAHYCLDSLDVIQCVLEKDVAWHAPGANNNGIGIEHAGYASQSALNWDDEYSEAMLVLSAKLTAEICTRYGIPVVRLSVADLKAKARGLCGHVDITNAFNGGKGHFDPGGNFPWAHYLDLVASNMPPEYVDTELVVPKHPPDAA